MILHFLLFLSAVKNYACFSEKPLERAPYCSNINITIYPKDPFLSQEISVVAVCTSLGSKPMPCPTCTVEDSHKKYYLGKIITYDDGKRCSTYFQIYVDSGKNKTDLRITCRIGNHFFTKQIVVKKSKNNGRCYDTADCMYSSQECIQNVCVCPKGTIFVEAKQDCYRKKSSPECQNLTVSINNRFPRFSDVVSVVASCTSNTKKCSENSPYPAVDFISPGVEIVPVRNISYYIGPKCFRHVGFTFGNKNGYGSFSSRDLRVAMRFRIPKGESNESIYVHTNSYSESCRQDRDCKELLQCYNYRCLCFSGYEYVPETGNCFPSVSRLYGACAYTEQCSFRGSICWQGFCECQPKFWLDTNSDSCVQEARSLGETCELDRHCKLRNDHSVCSKQICTCTVGWEEKNELCVLISDSGTTSRHQLGFLNTIAMIIITLKFGVWKFKN